eukprot:CAMPEP_0184735420 /NCGR_PEP_ID=MMETSP0314-20130426/61883_1 /TAXON_ID=38298 /ORGANISM="Rhodella maculata, Strain CCMP 736" /LENGTH=63 /DNA_ID=CAMNT_0027202463 /DNA_START=297 /DNA_END=488 /DNA_ORIENTATION=+
MAPANHQQIMPTPKIIPMIWETLPQQLVKSMLIVFSFQSERRFNGEEERLRNSLDHAQLSQRP